MIHKATIAIAVAGFLVYAASQGRRFRATGDPLAGAGAAAGIGSAVVTALYLRKLVRERAPRA